MRYKVKHLTTAKYIMSLQLPLSTKLVISSKNEIRFDWQDLFSIKPCWLMLIIFLPFNSLSIESYISFSDYFARDRCWLAWIPWFSCETQAPGLLFLGAGVGVSSPHGPFPACFHPAKCTVCEGRVCAELWVPFPAQILLQPLPWVCRHQKQSALSCCLTLSAFLTSPDKN